MSSKLLDHEDDWIFVKSGPTVSLCLYKKNFIPHLTNRLTFQRFPSQFVIISAKFGSSHFKLNVQIRNYFENIIFIVCK